jgi:putative transposase
VSSSSAVLIFEFDNGSEEARHKISYTDLALYNVNLFAVWDSERWVIYLRTIQRWFYLAVLIDLFRHLVVGWQVNERIDAKLFADALDAAMLMRGKPKGVLIHSDRVSQYYSEAFVKRVAL